FRKQRTRWIESQLIHIRLFIKEAKEINFRSMNVLNKFISNLFPPRIILLGLLIIINICTLLPIQVISPGQPSWLILLIIYILSLLLSIPARFFTLRGLKAITY